MGAGRVLHMRECELCIGIRGICPCGTSMCLPVAAHTVLLSTLHLTRLARKTGLTTQPPEPSPSLPCCRRSAALPPRTLPWLAAGEQHGQQAQQRGQGPGRGRGGSGLSPSGKRLLQELMKEGLGDHVLFLRMFQVRCICGEQGVGGTCPGSKMSR